MEDALHDLPHYREFAMVGEGVARLPDASTILRFRHLLERHSPAPDMLRRVNDILRGKVLPRGTGTTADATLIAAPSSTKNADGDRDPHLKQSGSGNNRHFGKRHIGADAASGLVDTVVSTPPRINDLNVAAQPPCGYCEAAFGYAGCARVYRRPETERPTEYGAMRPGIRNTLNPFVAPDFVAERVNEVKGGSRPKAVHPFWVVRREVGFTKVRWRDLAKNTAQVIILFASSNLWMDRGNLLGLDGQQRPQMATWA